jgi:hypothetical protein
MTDTSSPSPVKAHCAECGGLRNCDVRGEWQKTDHDELVWFTTGWRILECRGCENVFLQTVLTCSEDYDHDEDGNISLNEVVRYWPAPSKRKRPEWMLETGINAENVEGLDVAMRELYGAMNSDLPMLSAIGIRTCFDVAATLLDVDPDLTFTSKLDELVVLGKIGTLDKDRLATLIDAGSASIHRGWTPKPDELNTMVDLLEHFVFDSFVAPARRRWLDEKARKLRANVPKREKKASASKSTE